MSENHKNTLKTTFYLNVTKTKKVDSAWASNEKAADSHDGLSAADAKEEQLPGCVEHVADLSEEIVSDALSCFCHCHDCHVVMIVIKVF